jgi:predicted nucleic acid-binding protein
VSKFIVLDATPLGLLCYPNPRGEALRCSVWAQAIRNGSGVLFVPEIVDYEVRRELIRAGRVRSVHMLDKFLRDNLTIRLTGDQLLHAAQLWAQVRQAGLPTASPDSLDADAILAAQALSLNDPNVIVATSNPAHLQRFVPAEDWRNIPTS